MKSITSSIIGLIAALASACSGAPGTEQSTAEPSDDLAQLEDVDREYAAVVREPDAQGPGVAVTEGLPDTDPNYAEPLAAAAAESPPEDTLEEADVSLEVEDLSAGRAALVAGCSTHEINVSGGEAHYTECQSGESRSIDGWLVDTKSDGKCAQVYALDAGGNRFDTNRACPKDEIEYFFWSSRTSDIRVFLRVVG